MNGDAEPQLTTETNQPMEQKEFMEKIREISIRLSIETQDCNFPTLKDMPIRNIIHDLILHSDCSEYIREYLKRLEIKLDELYLANEGLCWEISQYD